MGGPVKGRRRRIDLDACDFRRRSIGFADDPQPPVLHDKPVEPNRSEPRGRQHRPSRRAVGAARDRQHGLVQANVRKPDLAARKLDERKLRPRGSKRQFRPIRAWSGRDAFAQRKIWRRKKTTSIGPLRETPAPVIEPSSASISARSAGPSLPGAARRAPPTSGRRGRARRWSGHNARSNGFHFASTSCRRKDSATIRG